MDNAAHQQLAQHGDVHEDRREVTACAIGSKSLAVTGQAATVTSVQTSFVEPDLQASMSDYGSDIDTDDEHELRDVFARIEGAKDFTTGIEVKESELDDNEVLRSLRLPKSLSSQDSARTSVYYSTAENDSEAPDRTSAGVYSGQAGHPVSTINTARLKDGQIDERPGHDRKSATQTVAPEGLDATQSSDEVPALQELCKPPISRFRASRPLSVSDLVSPTWCELQYSKNLHKHGKIPRSAAMKKGGEVHKKLELEVHDFVPVEVRTKEDAWGLRIWNIIQGLRTLRTTGMTRELDVWGIVDGELVSGVIDEVSFTCPDPELEMAMQPAEEEQTSSQKADPDQMTIDEFFAIRKARQDKIEEAGQQLYLLDTKTRAWPNLPTESSMRPTKVQLMLYRHLLSLHAVNAVPGETIFKRYNLDSSKEFSSHFIDEISKLESNFSSQSDNTPTEAATVSELRTHPTLDALWGLMASEFVITFSDLKISPILTAVYRTQASGSFIGQKTFVHNDSALSAHVADELRWWRGEREPRGVEIEDAFKCKMCEFADDCAWRLAKEAEAVERNRERKRKPRSPSRKKSVDADVKMEAA